ncbi:tyrosine-type recombinase/integrase [Haloarcula laminariae]|uniref:tyrosine-type recombinase/integrase n=1 Tax=Haloarcula laminariae TaxID=2961577 RepID=UPI0021C9A743|nr:site-specific integrase [Halomicroarcula laminariae]
MSDKNAPPESTTTIPEAHELNENHESLFTDFFEARSYEDTSVGTRESDIRAYLDWCERNDVEADDADDSDIHQYITSIKDEKAGQTVISRVNSVSIFYVVLGNVGEVDIENPCASINLREDYEIKSNQTKQLQVIVDKTRSTDDPGAKLALKPEQFEKIFDHAPNPKIRNELMMRLAFECGLRPIEISRLKVRDVDRENQHLTVDSAKIKDQEDELYFRDQWWTSDRTDYLMYRWLAEKRPDLPTASDPDDPLNLDYEDDDSNDEYLDEQLFLTSHNDELRPSYFGRLIRETACKDEVGLNEVLYIDGNGKKRWLVSGHSARISYITYMANHSPVKIPVLASLCGHKKVETTYSYVYTDDDTLELNQKEYAPLSDD